MKENKITEELALMDTDFKVGFAAKVLESIEAQRSIIQMPNIRMILYPAAAAVVCMLMIVYFQDGTLDYDAILGLTGYESDNVTQYFDYL